MPDTQSKMQLSGVYYKFTASYIFLNLLFQFFMKSLIKKGKATTEAKQAQCCAKISKTVVGCHD